MDEQMSVNEQANKLMCSYVSITLFKQVMLLCAMGRHNL